MTPRPAKLLVPSCVLGLALAACNGGGEGGGEAGANGSGGGGVAGQAGTGGMNGAGGQTGAGGMQGSGGVSATGGAGGGGGASTNLWTSSGNNYCVAAAVNSNVLVENNAFVNVRDTMDTANYSNAATIALARNNMYSGTAAATANKGTGVFTPPYPYTPDDPSTVQAAVMAGAGPH